MARPVPSTPVCIALIVLGVGAFAALAFDIARAGSFALDGSTDLAVRSLYAGLAAQRDLVAEVLRDFTALGSNGVVVLLTAVGAACLLAAGDRRRAALLVAACAGALVLVGLAKLGFARPRPDAASGVQVFTTSFPSSHATVSAAVYLALAGLLSSRQGQRATTAVLFSAAVVLCLLVGGSRIGLGVHWLSDVLAGWALGTAWAMGCCLVDGRLAARERRRGT